LAELKMVVCDEGEEWCVLERVVGEFTTFCPVCPENVLPEIGDQVAMLDSLLACNAQNGAHTIKQLTHIVRYYNGIERKRKLASLDSAVDDSLKVIYKSVNVASDGSDIYDSECCPLLDRTGRVFALYTAHFDYIEHECNGRHAQVLSRLHAFKTWFNAMFPELAI